MRSFLLILFLQTAAYAGVFSSVPRQYRPAVQAIEALPEAQNLLRRVEKEGKVRLISGSGAFEGFWEGGSTRTITVASARSPGAIIGTILFELNNAASERMLQELVDRASAGDLDREGYVEGVERVEYGTATRTAELIEQGIERGLFPVEARMHIFHNFDEHYRYQQWAGHSDWIARSYDRMFAG